MKKSLQNLSLSYLLLITAPSAYTQNYHLAFDGSNDYVQLPSSVQPSGSAFTAEAWVYLDAAGGVDQKVLLNLTWSGGAKGFALNIYKNAGGFYFCPSIYAGSNSFFTPNSDNIPAGTWTHIAMTWVQNSGITGYLNGKAFGFTSTGSYAYTSSGVSTYMGAGDGAGWAPLNGQIDDIRIWNSAKTEAELAASMNDELTGTETGLAVYYKMSNGSGTTLSDNKSGGTANGTLYNGVSWIPGTILPVSFQSVKAEAKTNGNIVYWVTSAEPGNRYFIIERSTDAEHFYSIGSVTSLGNEGDIKSYSWVDEQPLKGVNFYRIRQVDVNGESACSAITNCSSIKSAATIRLLTNPVTNGQLEVVMPKAGTLFIYNTNGTLLIKKELAAGNQSIDCSRLQRGYYSIKSGQGSAAVIIQ